MQKKMGERETKDSLAWFEKLFHHENSAMFSQDSSHQKATYPNVNTVPALAAPSQAFNTPHPTPVLSERASTNSTLLARASLLFSKLDLDGDGYLVSGELITILKSAGLSDEASWNQTSLIMGKIDQDRSNSIDIAEFLEHFQNEEVCCCL